MSNNRLPQLQANAQLIAASPDLLEAAEWALKALIILNPNNLGDAQENAMEMLAAAIRKAKGFHVTRP